MSKETVPSDDAGDSVAKTAYNDFPTFAYQVESGETIMESVTVQYPTWHEKKDGRVACVGRFFLCVMQPPDGYATWQWSIIQANNYGDENIAAMIDCSVANDGIGEADMESATRAVWKRYCDWIGGSVQSEPGIP